MNRDAITLIEEVDAYVHALDRVSVNGRFDDAGSAGPIRLLTDDELLDAQRRTARLSRLIAAEGVKVAGEIARRSETRDGGLAARLGAVNATALVSELSGSTRAAAGAAVRLGRVTRPQVDDDGLPSSPKRPHLARAVASGRLPLEIADAIRRMLGTLAQLVPADELDSLEAVIVEKALEGEQADRFLDWLRTVPNQIDPRGAEEREKDLVDAATVRRMRLQNGLTRWTMDLDPLTDGLFATALDANTARARVQLRTPDEPAPIPQATEHERKSLDKRRVDGLRLLAKKVVKVDDGQVGGTAVTLLVTMTEEALVSGIGAAQLPDRQSEISASTARMLAADAEIIPVVLGGESRPLDLGTGRRFFTEAQRRAMAVRDGGCAGICGGAPPSWCDGAHIRPAGYGSTSVDNGVLLCWHCHQLLDEHGWQISRRDGRWWWTPPPWIDPTGTPRPGGSIPPLRPAA